jgi:predicted transcriptional regulator
VNEAVAQDSEYLAFLQRKVDQARADIAAGRVHSHEEVEAEMDALFAELERKNRKRPA